MKNYRDLIVWQKSMRLSLKYIVAQKYFQKMSAMA